MFKYNDHNNCLDTMILVYCICHLLGMSSACTNPILYGFLNEKFVKVKQTKSVLKISKELVLFFSLIEYFLRKESEKKVAEFQVCAI